MSNLWLAVSGDPTAVGVKPETKSSYLRSIIALSTSSKGSKPEAANTCRGMPPRTSRRSLTCMQHLVVTTLGLEQC